MSTTELKYLQFVRFKDITQWDLKRYLNQLIKSRFPIVTLNEHIKEESTKYNISDPQTNYGMLGVNNQTGIFDAYIESGSKIKQKYKRMENGWIAYNPYRVNIGSIGIKKKEHKYEFISPAYVVFSCQNSLLPEYLFLTMKTLKFNSIIRDNTTGSVRQNLSYENLKTLQIPLPTLSEQQALIDTYNAKLQQAEDLEKLAEQKKKEIEEYLLQELGIEEHENQSVKKDSYLEFVRFKDIERWDCYNNKNKGHSSFYNEVPLSKILIEKPQYGAAYKAKDKASDIRYIRITDITEDGSLTDTFASADQFKEQYLLNQYDFLIARSGATVGKTFLYEEKYGKAIFAGYLIRFVLNKSMVDPYYILV
ncbi:MAG: restriction endonuclease subunit S [Treponema phagedenis]|uniref:restriction endonuclease subunit S n=1 Tax=Treponema phagedenis TaxID=162 RepID=UPI0004639B0D|nr:restriction endonuclease subunit S [Treponema phagedenis]QEJ94834.1 hypothetical protein FUT79_06165 [Treponema phagedenis]